MLTLYNAKTDQKFLLFKLGIGIITILTIDFRYQQHGTSEKIKNDEEFSLKVLSIRKLF